MYREILGCIAIIEPDLSFKLKGFYLSLIWINLGQIVAKTAAATVAIPAASPVALAQPTVSIKPFWVSAVPSQAVIQSSTVAVAASRPSSPERYSLAPVELFQKLSRST